MPLECSRLQNRCQWTARETVEAAARSVRNQFTVIAEAQVIDEVDIDSLAI